jgi:hypothetical protein
MHRRTIFAAAALSLATACNAGGNGRMLPASGAGGAPAWHAAARRGHRADPTSLLRLLAKNVTIGSTVDPVNGDQNPYGLAVAPAKAGKLAAGSLLICNNNDKANTGGAGTTIEMLAARPGSKPARFAQNAKLMGCSALAFDRCQNDVWAAASGARDVVELSASGSIVKSIAGKNYRQPFGLAWASTAAGGFGCTYVTTAVYTSDATTGSLLLTAYSASGAPPSYPGTPIATGFAVNHGKPGGVLGPSGVQFDPSNPKGQTLYVADGVTNTVVAIGGACGQNYNVIGINKANSIVVRPGGKTFGGPLARLACVVYSGKPLNAPISIGLLPNHNIVVGNTADNKLVELETSAATVPAKVLATRAVAKGVPGAIFGIAATGKTDATTKIYFNDDNTNSVQALQK